MSDKDYSDRQYGDLASSTKSDPGRSRAEQEFNVGFSKKDDQAIVYSSHPPIAKRLLLHDHFELDWFETTAPNDVNAKVQRVDADEYDEEGHDRRKPVYSVRGRLPIGVLTISQNPRTSRGPASVVTSGVL